ncbi:unnamed protein product, partial [Brugia timori]|uniref:SHSP domain-containing protein n=1 Tax=Brugia timori TaxID=42155 RepID=A0A0R3QVK1_9BILA
CRVNWIISEKKCQRHHSISHRRLDDYDLQNYFKMSIQKYPPQQNYSGHGYSYPPQPQQSYYPNQPQPSLGYGYGQQPTIISTNEILKIEVCVTVSLFRQTTAPPRSSGYDSRLRLTNLKTFFSVNEIPGRPIHDCFHKHTTKYKNKIKSVLLTGNASMVITLPRKQHISSLNSDSSHARGIASPPLNY